MASNFTYRGKAFGISDRNDQGEFIVVKIGKGKKIEAAKVIPAKTEAAAIKMIKTGSFENFRNLEGAVNN
jgi:hypothetical protein